MKLSPRVVGGLVAIACLAAAAAAQAQESRSAPLARQLAAALDAAKLDSIGAKDPSAPDAFCAALYFPGAQLLVVAASYAAPQYLVDRLAKKEYRDIYLDLNGAAKANTKVFVQDGAADGLKAKSSDNQAPDSYEAAGKQTVFDGDAKRQK